MGGVIRKGCHFSKCVEGGRHEEEERKLFFLCERGGMIREKGGEGR